MKNTKVNGRIKMDLSLRHIYFEMIPSMKKPSEFGRLFRHIPGDASNSF
jgi:hypothetical protein